MRPKLKRLEEQVMVITGASSGIGLATARLAARRGARLVLASRNERALQQLVDEIHGQGGEAIRVVADVGNPDDVQRIADAAIARFGGFDTWVNNAGSMIYGLVEETKLEDARRLFDTNFWGMAHGAQVAVRHLKQRGGAIVNVGSDLSEHAAPLMGFYSASKHAVLGLMDALRVELQNENAPVSVSLIRPAGIDTQILKHARNYMDVEPQLPPPVYAPQVVADAILHAAEHYTRDVYAGATARLLASITHLAPALSDWVMQRWMLDVMRSDRPAAEQAPEGLHSSAEAELRERGGSQRLVLERSLYTKAALHRNTSRLVALGLGLVAARLMLGRRPHARGAKSTRKRRLSALADARASQSKSQLTR
jgi:short-subunit dehydrogenase